MNLLYVIVNIMNKSIKADDTLFLTPTLAGYLNKLDKNFVKFDKFHCFENLFAIILSFCFNFKFPIFFSPIRKIMKDPHF